jgi:hypothetical protein
MSWPDAKALDSKRLNKCAQKPGNGAQTRLFVENLNFSTEVFAPRLVLHTFCGQDCVQYSDSLPK